MSDALCSPILGHVYQNPILLATNVKQHILALSLESLKVPILLCLQGITYGVLTDKTRQRLGQRFLYICRRVGLSGSSCSYLGHECLELGRKTHTECWCVVTISAKEISGQPHRGANYEWNRAKMRLDKKWVSSQKCVFLDTICRGQAHELCKGHFMWKCCMCLNSNVVTFSKTGS